MVIQLVNFAQDNASRAGPAQVDVERFKPGAAFLRHPNEIDRRRVERALAGRRRYRYVTPIVNSIDGGYEIVSPCCSRNIDPDGGIVDIARFQYLDELDSWHLYRKDHGLNIWIRHGDFKTLPLLLELLRDDPERWFWQ